MEKKNQFITITLNSSSLYMIIEAEPLHLSVPHSFLSSVSPSQGLPPATGGEQERDLVAEPPSQDVLQLLQGDQGDQEPFTMMKICYLSH